MTPPSSSFTVRQVNKSTFLITERDKYREHPFIYAKLHPNAPILILNDTGCDAPDDAFKHAQITHLKPFLETYPVPELNGRAINPSGALQYVIILSHCHYDHICGIEQFLEDDRTEIIASAAGRDFIESDLGAHSLCKQINIPTPVFKVTHWAQSNERLTWPLQRTLPGDDAHDKEKPIDLGILILHTPGHTPDALSWYDYEELTIYVGDSFYRLSNEMEPIYFPPQGDLIDWFESRLKVESFVGYNQEYADSDTDSATVTSIKLSAAHTTCNADAYQCLTQARMFWQPLISRWRKPLGSSIRFGEVFDYYTLDLNRDSPSDSMAMLIPRRLVDYANAYYAQG